MMQARPARSLALEKYRRVASTYERRLRLLRPLVESCRSQAIALLDLRPGHVILDVGCGTGLSFAKLEDVIGPTGHLIAIEQSPDMLARARDRVTDSRWSNVTIIQAPAEEAVIPGSADAAFFFFTHDILRSPRALENVLRAVHPGGRVVAAGMKRAAWWALPLNVFALLVACPYVTTWDGASRPWSLLMAHLSNFRKQVRGLGLVYIVEGFVPRRVAGRC